ncbi:MAG TPA: AmmeMemoRadiSam system protein B [Armatimonadota bacterium]|nr:AmmeMemoRadiSam system protein B [Armatimonadota bacterium]
MQNSRREGAVRQPAVAGMFYPGETAELHQSIVEAFTSPLGPGGMPSVPQTRIRRVFGIVVPHAGYQFSAQGAAWSFAEAAHDGKPQAIVILGVNHRGIGAPLAVSPASGWQTPLGISPVDDGIRQRLLESNAQITADEHAHAMEHSLEVQVPFIQTLFGVTPIVPIVMGHLSRDEVFQLGHTIASIASEMDILVVASSDLSHYISFREAEILDHLALEMIAAIDPDGLLNAVRQREISMCGALPVTAMLVAAREAGVGTAKILHYHTSGDVTGDRQEVVGYGAAALYR